MDLMAWAFLGVHVAALMNWRMFWGYGQDPCHLL